MPVNQFGQPVGEPLGEWRSPTAPPPVLLNGRYVQLRPPTATADAAELFDAFSKASDDTWTYLSWGPFAAAAELQAVIENIANRHDWEPWVAEVDGQLVGFGSYLRIDPRNGVIEIGGLCFSPLLQRTPASTEIHSLLIGNAFELGYRRVEWKCDSLNAPSRRAATRLGFVEEGTFAKATHYKGRSRDTTWFAITDDRWPALKAGFDAWLDPANFDAEGQQLRRLEDLRGAG